MDLLDSTGDYLTNMKFNNKYHEFIKKASKTSDFTETEIYCILMVYNKFAISDGKKLNYAMTSKTLFQIYQSWYIKDPIIIERFVMKHSTLKKIVTPQGWLDIVTIGMSTDLQLKIKYVFEIYDVEGKGALARNVVAHYVTKMFPIGTEDEEIAELAVDMMETIFAKFDLDKDGFISFEEYKFVVEEKPLLLEFLGQVFPIQNWLNVQAYCMAIMSKFPY